MTKRNHPKPPPSAPMWLPTPSSDEVARFRKLMLAEGIELSVAEAADAARRLLAACYLMNVYDGRWTPTDEAGIRPAPEVPEEFHLAREGGVDPDGHRCGTR